MIKETYLNTKNYSGLSNNYSFIINMLREINKVRKHQPNASLSKLIDLGEFEANNKITSDNVIKNIAQNFKMHR